MGDICDAEMWDCEAWLRNLIASVEPSVAQKAGASRSHNHLRELMDLGRFGSGIVDSYLSGSYARDTAIAPIDDVDIIFVIDPRARADGMWSRPTPDRVLETFAAAIRYRYPDSSVRTQRRSVCLQLNHLDIDVVPAIRHASIPEGIHIPDSNSGNWIYSAPKKHTEIAVAVNQARDGRFKPLVKLLKFWNASMPATARLKSFAIETMATTLFRQISLPTFQDGLRLFFDFVAELDGKAALYAWPSRYGISMNWSATEIPDLAGSGSNLAANVDADRRAKFIEHAVHSRDAMAVAENARTLASAEAHIRRALRF
jgi:hypothetical protein